MSNECRTIDVASSQCLEIVEQVVSFGVSMREKVLVCVVSSSCLNRSERAAVAR